jgi:putative transposase
MTRDSTLTRAPVSGAVEAAFADVQQSFERLCLAAGMDALGAMMEADVEAACGPRHGRDKTRGAHRWGSTRGTIGFHGGKVAVERPRVRGLDGREMAIPSWDRATAEDWLGRWAMNLMLINVSTRRFGRAVRLPEGDLPAASGSGISKSAASRRFVALSSQKLEAFMQTDLSQLDLLVIQIDGLHISEDLVLVAAIGIDGDGGKHPLALVEGATENTATVQALLDNLVERGIDPAVSRLFIVDGAKALSKAIRATFGTTVAIQRCQIHKARNVMDRLPKELRASTRRVLRQAWELDDAEKADKLIRNLARRLDQDRPGVAASILEGLDEILTVVRLKLPIELRRSLACTNIAENMMGTIRRVTRNVKRWRNGRMALRWVAAGMIEAAKGFRKLKAHKQLPVLRAALIAHHERNEANSIATDARAA